MNGTQISILLYERDAHQTQTMQWALQSSGYRVLSASHLGQFDSIPLTPPIDLLVLGHTLTSRECAAAIAHASVRWPRIKRLTLVHDNSSALAAARGRRLHLMDAPTRLLSTVSELVGCAASSPCSHIY